MNKILDLNNISNSKIEIIKNILCSKEFKETTNSIMQKESKSLLTPSALAFLDQLVKKTNIKSVLEIGTFRGGATKILANAIKGKGIILTLDSNQDRKPIIEAEIGSWSKLMQETTIFLSLTSYEFFEVFKYSEGKLFDLCFIDGDHSHTGALSDIINCSKFSAPNSIIVIDDANQPPVYTAAHDFLKLYPNWSEISGILNNHNNIDNTQSSFKELPFLILVGPNYHSINNRPYSIYKETDATLNGININLKNTQEAGEVQIRLLITHIGNEKNNEIKMTVIDLKKKINQDNKIINVLLDEPFVHKSSIPFRVEAHIYWSTTDINSSLTLIENPKFILS
ncbi:class I SAM-dependent methyltransferase [Alphaproteobacteria bacterium]|nr:class I SAM-dependent methyltransferase [Alphaproteobacteria bacterium]